MTERMPTYSSYLIDSLLAYREARVLQPTVILQTYGHVLNLVEALILNDLQRGVLLDRHHTLSDLIQMC